MVGAARVRGGPRAGLGELALDAGARRAKERALEEQAYRQLVGEAHHHVDRDARADLPRGLERDLFAGQPTREANDDRCERRRNDGMGVGDSLRVAQDQDTTVLPVRHDDRLDGAQHGAGAWVHRPPV